jgi:hypothetical protein
MNRPDFGEVLKTEKSFLFSGVKGPLRINSGVGDRVRERTT